MDIGLKYVCPYKVGGYKYSDEETCTFNLETSGKSTNFNYENIKVKVRVKGSFLPYEA